MKVQSHFDYASPTWYSSQENLQKEIVGYAKQMYLLFSRTICHPYPKEESGYWE